jgi:hypothetical protein
MLARGALRTGFGLFLLIISLTLAGCAKQSSAPVSQTVPKKEEAIPSPVQTGGNTAGRGQGDAEATAP